MKLGKVGKRNKIAASKLKELYTEQEIYSCELQLEGCLGSNFLGFAHRHKRVWYYPEDKQVLLSDFNQTVLSCQNCHSRIEYNKELTEKMFNKLRGKENERPN